jgi:hypothetical protein
MPLALVRKHHSAKGAIIHLQDFSCNFSNAARSEFPYMQGSHWDTSDLHILGSIPTMVLVEIDENGSFWRLSSDFFTNISQLGAHISNDLFMMNA